ncbi:MAG: hypothetical protein MUO38_01945 [Anaerolineales bacterium]|nr:hypothetical protein [Anaerolineales bacterium]
MSQQPMGGMEITSDDKLWALLAYIFSPLVPIIILLMEDKKSRPFIRAHNMQALILGVINVVIAMVIGWLLVPLCLNLLIAVYLIYLAIKAYQGELVNIPVITDFCKKQGWA